MDALRSRVVGSITTAAAAVVLITGCTRESDPQPAPVPSSPSHTSTSPETDPETEPTDATDEADPTTDPTTEPSDDSTENPPHPISLVALARADLTGGGLRLGAVREQTATYTSYDVTFASTTMGAGTHPLRISGVLNVPIGRGPFPAVVLAHGYIDPAVYVRGQGMTRERGFLAERGYVALHVDYRNHAESTDDPRIETAVRLGYAADVVAAVHALRDSRAARVDPDRVALFGRSMGGGVMMKALAAEPGLFAAGVGWASVSSLEGQNFDHFQRPDAPVAQLRAGLRGRHGLPGEDRDFWRGASPRPLFEEITEPVLMVHGRFDDTCPPRWARATQRAMVRTGVDATLEWYDDGHAFGPAFVEAMNRTVRFLDVRMPA